MKLTASIIAVAALAVVGSALYLGGVGELNACTTSASTASASCQVECTNLAATVTANAGACCKASVAKVMEKFCNTSTASASGCAKSASTKTASSSSCSKSASTKTASSSGCSTSASTKTASSSCSKSASTAATADASLFCAKTIEAMMADSHECCKSTVAAFVAACNESASKTASAGCSKSASAYASAGSSSSCSKSASTAAIAYDMPYRTGTRLVLTGTSLCGMCNLKATEACLPVFQTADGKIYPLVKNSYTKEMRNAKSDKGFEIVTRVRRVDGVKYLEVETLKTL